MVSLEIRAITVMMGIEYKEKEEKKLNIKEKAKEKFNLKRKDLELDDDEIENVISEYLDTIKDKDEDIISINLRKKTFKKMFKHYLLNGNLSGCEIKSDEEEQEDNSKREEDELLHIIEKQKEDLYLKFKQNLEVNFNKKNLGFEIDQILKDLCMQLSHSSVQNNKKYNKYVSIM